MWKDKDNEKINWDNCNRITKNDEIIIIKAIICIHTVLGSCEKGWVLPL